MMIGDGHVEMGRGWECEFWSIMEDWQKANLWHVLGVCVSCTSSFKNDTVQDPHHMSETIHSTEPTATSLNPFLLF